MSKRSPNTYQKIHTIFKRGERNIIQPDEPFSVPEIEYLRGLLWHTEEKIDGTNVRIEIYTEDAGDGLSRLRVRYAGKTDNAQMPVPLMEHLRETYPAERVIAALEWNEVCEHPAGEVLATIYGEGYGEKIQDVGSKYRAGQSFIAFDVKVGDTCLDIPDRNAVLKSMGAPIVPHVGDMTVDVAISFVRTGFRSFISEEPIFAEGLVLRPLVRLKNARGERIIAKLKHDDFVKYDIYMKEAGTK